MHQLLPRRSAPHRGTSVPRRLARAAAVTTLLLAAGAAGAAAPAALAASEPPAASAPPSAAQLVEDYRAVYGTPGVAAAVITSGGVERVTSGRDGDGREVTASTPFRIASISKSMTAAAVMLLVERGEFGLDDPVAELLPEFRLDDPRAGEVTVRQLLTHRSGLSIRTNDEYALPPAGTAAEAVARLADRHLAWDPGSQFEYHNTNYAIAARLVELVSGQPFEAFLAEELFAPLGMDGTLATEGCSEEVAGVPDGHEVALGFAVDVPEMPGLCAGNGGVISTLDDLVRWMRFNTGATAGPLTADSLDTLHRATAASDGYALGWQDRRSPSGVPLVGHGGTLATWTGDVVFVPGDGTAVVVLTNAAGSPGELSANLLAGVMGDPILPIENPFTVLNAVLLALTVVIGILLILAIVRAPRWARRRVFAKRPLVVLRMLPIAALVVAGALLPMLMNANTGLITNWVVTVWLLPMAAILGIVCVGLGLAALVCRIAGYARARRRAAAPLA
ncbi:serine hydrolase domain-containing protein [Agromyces mediolanus]|uniref:serine hydrolase domain-containing protein n=1 Tax=Agromyces mediolanus TaxID=41986 RepID=UPI0038329333